MHETDSQPFLSTKGFCSILDSKFIAGANFGKWQMEMAKFVI